MKAPDKIYLGFQDGFVAMSSNVKEDANGNSIFLPEYEPVEYIRKDALLEWANNMKRICKGAEPIQILLEKAYQTMIEKIESL